MMSVLILLTVALLVLILATAFLVIRRYFTVLFAATVLTTAVALSIWYVNFWYVNNSHVAETQAQ